MDEFKNSLVNGIHKSRYIASWIYAGGELHGSKGGNHKFVQWLKTLIINDRHLTEDEIKSIDFFARNGKLELQELAKEFLKGA